MKIKILQKIFTLLAIFVCVACDSKQEEQVIQAEKAKNIILLIGDGMGPEQLKATRWYKVGEQGKLNLEKIKSSGWLHTHSADDEITDSAASATAYATGVKTNNGMIGIDPDGNSVVSILEHAKQLGKSVGLVTTTQISHATPASFAAHVENRKLTSDIAKDIFEAQVDVLLGGGENDFLPQTTTGCFKKAGKRQDNRNLIDEFTANGYVYTCDFQSFTSVNPASTKKLIGLFADEGMVRPFQPSLAAMTVKAIDILSQNSKGFFLMVEGGQIDWAGHANDALNAILDTIDFDKTVGLALNHPVAKDNTLIIVTADHETGGMRVSRNSKGKKDEDGPFKSADGKQFYINWTTKKHTPIDVQIFSQGPSSRYFIGVHENTFVYHVMYKSLQ